MPGPWEDYKSAAPASADEGPWAQYRQKPAEGVGRTSPAVGAAGAANLSAPAAPTTPEPEIDYLTGAPLNVRVQLSRASNPKEAELALGQIYPKGKFGQDQRGEWWVDQGGKRTSVMPKSLQNKWSAGPENLLATTIAGASPMAGALGGAMVGAPAGPLGMAAGAAVGAAGGKGMDDMMKWAQGKFDQKPKEVMSDLATEAALAGVFQGAGPALKGLGKGAQGLIQKMADVTPETRAMSGELVSRGATPPVGSFAPGGTSLEYKRKMRNILYGENPREGANIDYLTKEVRRIFSLEGVPHPEIDKIIEQVYDKTSKPSARATGEALVKRADDIHSTLTGAYTRARGEAEDLLKSSEKTFRAAADVKDPLLAQHVGDAIVADRRAFGQKMSDVYKTVDRMTGDMPVVGTAGIRAAAKDLMQVLPPTAVPPIIKDWAGKQAKQAITFEQAHALRSTFREMADVSGLGPLGQRVGQAQRLAKAVDEAIQSPTSPVGETAAKALRAADADYAKGIAKYHDATLNKLVKDVKSGLLPEPHVTAQTVMRPDNINAARQVLQILPPEVRQKVITADMRNIMEAASTLDRNGQATLEADKFLKLLNDRKELMDATYSRPVAEMLRNHARDLARFEGRIELPNMGPPTAVAQKLQQATEAMQAADHFVKQNPLGALVKGTDLQVDRAVKMLTRPDNEAQLERAVRTLGADSPEVKALQKYVLTKMFSKAIESRSSLTKTISGNKIESALAKYTPNQLALLFPNGVDKDVRLLAKEAKFLFPDSAKDMGTSLAASEIEAHLWFDPRSVYAYVKYALVGYIADHPRLLRFMTNEIRKDPVQGRMLMSVIGQWATERAVENGPGRGLDDLPKPFQMPQKEDKPAEPATYGGPQ